MIPTPFLQKASQTEKKIHHEILEHMVAYITAAFGLVAGLAWNAAVQALIQYAFPLQDQNTLWAKFVYAVIITILVTLITIYFTRLMSRGQENNEEENSQDS